MDSSISPESWVAQFTSRTHVQYTLLLLDIIGIVCTYMYMYVLYKIHTYLVLACEK